MRSARILFGVVTALSFVVAAVVLWIGFQHNAQGELFDPGTGVIHFGYASLIFASWFIASFVILAAFGGILIGLARAVKRLRG